MAIDFSSIGGKPVSSAPVDFSSIGGKPAQAEVPTISPKKNKAPSSVPGAQLFSDAAQKLSDWANMTSGGRADHPIQAAVGDFLSRIKQMAVGGQGGGLDMKAGFATNPVLTTMSMAPGDEEIELARNVVTKGKDFLTAPLKSASVSEAGQFLDKLSGTTAAVKEAQIAREAALGDIETAKNANLSKYLLAEQKVSQKNAATMMEYEKDMAAAKAKIPPAAPGEQQNWIDLNKSIQTSANPSQVKVFMKAGNSDFSDVAAMPGRGLAAEGFDAKELAKMSPLQQREVLDPVITKAGKAVSEVADAATERGVKVNLYSVDESVDSIVDSNDRDAIRKIVNRIGKNLDITDWGNVTPNQALKLRQELYAAGGDNAEFASKAITKQLREAVPESKIIDRHFTDLASARTANDKALARYAAGKWKFPNMEPSLPEAPTLETLKVSPYTPLPETPEPVNAAAIRAQQLKKVAKIAVPAVIGGGVGASAVRHWIGQ